MQKVEIACIPISGIRLYHCIVLAVRLSSDTVNGEKGRDIPAKTHYASDITNVRIKVIENSLL